MANPECPFKVGDVVVFDRKQWEAYEATMDGTLNMGREPLGAVTITKIEWYGKDEDYSIFWNNGSDQAVSHHALRLAYHNNF